MLSDLSTFVANWQTPAPGGMLKAIFFGFSATMLGVMALFAIGNMLLKVKRARLPRLVRAGWPTVIYGLLAVSIGMLGNLLINPAYVRVFGVYFAVALAIVSVMFLRVQIPQGRVGRFERGR